MSNDFTDPTICVAGIFSEPTQKVLTETKLPIETNSERYKVVVSAFQTGTVDTAHTASVDLGLGKVGAVTRSIGIILCTAMFAPVTFEVVEPEELPYIFTYTTAGFAAMSVVNIQLTATRMG
jgi:hypothetical protein